MFKLVEITFTNMKRLFTKAFHLLLFGLSSLFAFSQAGSGYDLDLNGSSTYVDCGTINLSGSAITLQAWVKVQAFKSSSPWISSVIGTEDPNSSSSAFIRLGDGNLAPEKPQFVLRINGGPQKLDAISSLTTNQWYHLAATYDGTTMRLYINGVLDNTLTVSGTISSNGPFALGRNYADSRILNGEIDEASLFLTTLSESTIREYMCKNITSSHPNYADLDGYWPLNEGTGTTVADLSANSYNGTFVNTPTWKFSGAPIGDASKYIYNSTSFNFGIAHPNGDSLSVVSTSSGFDGVHIYRVDSIPNTTNVSSNLQYIDTIRYWGVFPVGAANYDATYHYDGNAAAVGLSCNLTLASRTTNASTSWAQQTPDSVNYANEFLQFASSGRKEIVMAIGQGGPHTLNYTINEPSCNGLSDGSADVNVSGGLAPYTYSWQTTSITSSSGAVSAGYTYVTITDANGCISNDSVLVTEPDTLSASANIVPATCADTNTGSIGVSMNGGTSPYSFSWSDLNNTTTASLQNAFSGNYSVTVTDNNGCTNSFSYSVGSTGPDPLPYLGNDSVICEGTVHGITTGSNGGPFNSFLWNNGSTGPILVVNQTGNYSVTVTNSTGCSGSDTIFLNYVAPIEVELGSSPIIGIGNATLDAGPGFNTYLWNTGGTAQTIQAFSSGEYWVKTSDSNGCKDADTIRVELAPNGLETINNQFVKIYPNPTSDVLHINLFDQNVSMKDIVITDLTGKQVQSSPGLQTFDVGYLSPGLYFITISTTDGKKNQFRFQKQ
jgi:hypothetical protein